jgi:starch phosphorylase
MAYLAIRGSGAVNGVSRLHGEVSRRIFTSLFPHWPEKEVPVGHVTNGVHMPSWDSAMADELWTATCAKDRWRGRPEVLEEQMVCVLDPAFWQLRSSARKSLIEHVRERYSRQLAASGAPPREVEEARHIFDIDTLTLGFARRFATYKRPNLLLRDTERLLRILNDPQRPVQLIIAGKAHPADYAGQAMIQEWTRFIRRPEARRRVVFLSDYDMLLTGRLVQGVDVWINTPRRPWEACGTSGMKVLVNGGLNLSELDGWWAEAYTPEVGWALGDGKEHDNDPAWDAAEAEALYTLLEQEVIPEFYARDSNGLPTAWVERIRQSMGRLTPRFSATRTVIDYTGQYYLPAAAAYRARVANKGEVGRQIVRWQQALERHWSNLRVGEVKVTSEGGKHRFEAHVYLGGLDPNAVRVQVYAEGLDRGEPVRQEMNLGQRLVGANAYVYSTEVVSPRLVSDYTLRIVPHFPGAGTPLEAHHILWQR